MVEKIKDIMGKIYDWMGKNVVATILIFVLAFGNLFTYMYYISEKNNSINIEKRYKDDIDKKNNEIETLEKDKEYYEEKSDSASDWFTFTDEEKEKFIKEHERNEEEKAEQERREQEEKERKEKEEQEKKEKEEEQARLEQEKEEEKKQSSKLEEARKHIESRASEVFSNGSYDVITKDGKVVLLTYVSVTQNDSIDDWNYLVESSKSASRTLQSEIGDVELFLMSGTDKDHIYLMIGNGVVYYDVFNGVDLLGIGGTNKGALQ